MATANIHLRTVVNEDGAAILDTKLGTISTLNPTGAFIWQALQRGDTPPAIAAQLARETGEQVNQLECDIHQFIAALKDRHLLPC